MSMIVDLCEKLNHLWRCPIEEPHEIKFSYNRGGRMFVKGTIEISILNNQNAQHRRQKVLIHSTLDQWVREELLDFLNSKHDLVNLSLRRQGRNGLKALIGHFLIHKMPEMDLRFQALHLDE